MIRKFLVLMLLCSTAFANTHKNNHKIKNQQTTQVTAESWLVSDESGRIIRAQNTEQVRSIASISKLITVMIVLDAQQRLDEKLGAYTRQEHIQLALVRSDNKSAEVLCQNYTGGREECVKAMNAKAASLYMKNTKFVEPTGLSVFNVSTANELVNLVIEASKYPMIVEAGHTSTAKIRVKKKWLIFHNTNPMIGYKQNIIVSKTGYIKASGGCLVMMIDTEVGRRIVILLGSKNTRTRIPEAEIIIRQSLEE